MVFQLLKVLKLGRLRFVLNEQTVAHMQTVQASLFVCPRVEKGEATKVRLSLGNPTEKRGLRNQTPNFFLRPEEKAPNNQRGEEKREHGTGGGFYCSLHGSLFIYFDDVIRPV